MMSSRGGSSRCEVQLELIYVSVVSRRRSSAGNKCSHGRSVPRLQKDGARASEFADKSFTGGHAGDQTSGSDAFELVLAVPCDKMSVIDNVFFVCLEL
jgi:hypothetical protein